MIFPQNPTASSKSYWELGSQDPPQFPGQGVVLHKIGIGFPYIASDLVDIVLNNSQLLCSALDCGDYITVQTGLSTYLTFELILSPVTTPAPCLTPPCQM